MTVEQSSDSGQKMGIQGGPASTKLCRTRRPCRLGVSAAQPGSRAGKCQARQSSLQRGRSKLGVDQKQYVQRNGWCGAREQGLPKSLCRDPAQAWPATCQGQAAAAQKRSGVASVGMRPGKRGVPAAPGDSSGALGALASPPPRARCTASSNRYPSRSLRVTMPCRTRNECGPGRPGASCAGAARRQRRAGAA